MGVKVSWLDLKKACNALPQFKLGIFIGALCHSIVTAMEEAHMKRLKHDYRVQTVFICTPSLLKCMWDKVQGNPNGKLQGNPNRK